MTEAEVRQAVHGALRGVAPEIDPAALAPDRSLRDQVDLDSVDYLNVLVALHERLGVDVPETDYDQVTTLDALVRYLAARVATPAPAP